MWWFLLTYFLFSFFFLYILPLLYLFFGVLLFNLFFLWFLFFRNFFDLILQACVFKAIFCVFKRRSSHWCDGVPVVRHFHLIYWRHRSGLFHVFLFLLLTIKNYKLFSLKLFQTFLGRVESLMQCSKIFLIRL